MTVDKSTGKRKKKKKKKRGTVAAQLTFVVVRPTISKQKNEPNQ